MRVVFDSNVLVAAFATHGVCHDLFEYCLRNTTIVCSDFIAAEVERILVSKIKTPAKTASEIIEYLKIQTEWVTPDNKYVEGLRDPNDQMIIATALSGEADFLITGDKDLLVLKQVKKTVMILPRDFWIKYQTA
ncbi:MAG: putative toxin-antitoxin system toxin component, PIN family [Candidatus Omnitrophota bacterium]